MRCSAADLWHGNYFSILQPFCLIFTIAAFLCYVVIWIKIRLKRNSKSSKEEKNRNDIIKSLTIILLFILFGWIFDMSVRLLINATVTQPVLSYILMNFTDLPLTFIGIFNTIVLYACRLLFN